MDKPDTPNTEEDTFDDLDLMDDSVEEEVWDDPAAEDDWVEDEESTLLDDDSELSALPQGKLAKKGKSSMFSMLLLLVVIGGGGGGAYYFMASQQQPGTDVSYPPVVQNVMPEDNNNQALSEIDETPTDSGTIETVDVNPIANTDEAPETAATDPFGNAVQQTSAPDNNDPGVLTPMPEVSDIKDTELASLDDEATEIAPSPFSDESPLSAIPAIDDETLLSPEEKDAVVEVDSPFGDSATPEMEIPVLESIDPAPANVTITEEIQESPVIALEEDIMLEKTEIEHKNPQPEPEKAPEKVVMAPKAPETKTKEVELAPKTPEKVVEVAPEPVKEPKAAPVKTAKETQTKPEKPVWKYKASDWILRSAQNGQAVIYNKRSRETKSVETGYTVSGIGRISSISKVNGKWVVKGSDGSVKQ